LVFQKDQMKELENRKEKLNDSISDEEELLANLKIDLGDLESNIEKLEANSKSIMDVLNEQKDTLRKIKDSIMSKEKDFIEYKFIRKGNYRYRYLSGKIIW